MDTTTTTKQRAPWLLIVGLLLGGAVLVYMSWGSLAPNRSERARSEHVVEFTESNWQKEVLESDIPVLVDFTAEWCGPCQAFAPTVEKLAARYKGKVKVGKFDVGDNSFHKANRLKREYEFSAVPTLMIFKGGTVHYQSKRGGNERELVAALESVLQ